MFTEFGYFKEYYIGNKFIGILDCEEKDRDVYGFFGKKIEESETIIFLKNGKKIPAGVSYMTFLFPNCGAKTEKI